MFTPSQIKERLQERPFRPFRIIMSNGETYDILNHDSAWVLRNAVEVGLDPDADGLALRTRRCAILHIASLEDLSPEHAG